MLFWCQQNTRNFAIHKRVYVVIFKITLLTYFAKKTLTSMRSIFRLRLLMTTSQAFVMHHLSIHISQHFVDNVTQSCLMFNSVTHSIGNVILLVARVILYILILRLDKNEWKIIMSISSCHWSFAYYLISVINFEKGPRNTFLSTYFRKKIPSEKCLGEFLTWQ